jgi:hypothetical protein
MPKDWGPGEHNRRYGAYHRGERARWARVVEQGGCVCVRCGVSIHPAESWDLDHNDSGDGYRGPAHASCNRSAGAQRREEMRQARGGAIPAGSSVAVPGLLTAGRSGSWDDPRRDERGVMHREWGDP